VTSVNSQMRDKFISLICFFCLFVSCQSKKDEESFKAYNGALEEADSIEVLHSEASILKIRLHTAKQFKYSNEDKVFPKTVYVDFFGPNKEIVTTMRGDSGRYVALTNVYKILGNVVVVKKTTQEQLKTDELIWNPSTKKVYSDKFSTIDMLLRGERIEGIGFSAEQDFSNMTIRKPTGFFNSPAGVQ
jgi:LPS export ABC transporter protein LptC